MQVPLDVMEQLLYRVEPRRVLSIEEYIHFELSCCLEDL
jgi:hypothetical protein